MGWRGGGLEGRWIGLVAEPGGRVGGWTSRCSGGWVGGSEGRWCCFLACRALLRLVVPPRSRPRTHLAWPWLAFRFVCPSLRRCTLRGGPFRKRKACRRQQPLRQEEGGLEEELEEEEEEGEKEGIAQEVEKGGGVEGEELEDMEAKGRKEWRRWKVWRIFRRRTLWPNRCTTRSRYLALPGIYIETTCMYSHFVLDCLVVWFSPLILLIDLISNCRAVVLSICS